MTIRQRLAEFRRDGTRPSLLSSGDLLNTLRTLPAVLVVASLVLTACANQASLPTVAPSSTPDPCAPGNLGQTIRQVDDLMQQFDDESALAANVARSQLAAHIATLQGIRRQAQALDVPGCAGQLRQLALTHMNTVVDTMLAFLSQGDQAVVAQGIQTGRTQRDAYVEEEARLLAAATAGVTPRVVSSPTIPPAGSTAAASAAGLAAFIVVNPGPVPLTLRGTPATAGEQVATLPVGESAVALGGSSDGAWIQVVVPDRPYQTAWVLASLVQITLPTPVATP